ncbi:MAG: hypothetical protein K5839_00715 [Treponemataceae bacterium]|nr:hypothetical protein [Treponemataceae bacterium]
MDKDFSPLAHYHLPGLFEFYDFYSVFLPLYRAHPEYFYDWCDIASIYGSPADCLWGGGRVGFGDADANDVQSLMARYGISARLTFSNSLLTEEHLADRKCNALCKRFAGGAAASGSATCGDGAMPHQNVPPCDSSVPSGAIVYSDLLVSYLKDKYPELYLVSSTTKVLTNFDDFRRELDRSDFRYVVADFRLNKAFEKLAGLTQAQKDKVEFLCNECCDIGCTARKECYENVSRKNLGLEVADHECTSGATTKPGAATQPATTASGSTTASATTKPATYRFSRAMENPAFISVDDIQKIYLPMGFSNFKIEGRSLGSAILLEFILYYMTKPECQLKVREEIYLDSMLDLF